MFIKFNNRVINTNFITQIWKTEEEQRSGIVYLIRIQLHQTNGSFREIYTNEEERDKYFDNLVEIINIK